SEEVATLLERVQAVETKIRRLIDAKLLDPVSEGSLSSPDILRRRFLDLLVDLGESGISIQFNEAGTPKPLPIEVTDCIYRIGDEAIRNVVNHSDSDIVSRELRWKRTTIEVEISDRGKGFHGAEGQYDHFGRRFMKAFASRIRAKLEWNTTGSGTTVLLQVPI